jgi:hypothetical protein
MSLKEEFKQLFTFLKRVAPLAAFGSIWQHLAAFGSIWQHLAATGSNWQHLAEIGLN